MIDIPVPAPWRHAAACSGLQDLFFAPDKARQQLAASICHTCPVLEPCAAELGGRRPAWGVQAGLLPRSP